MEALSSSLFLRERRRSVGRCSPSRHRLPPCVYRRRCWMQVVVRRLTALAIGSRLSPIVGHHPLPPPLAGSPSDRAGQHPSPAPTRYRGCGGGVGANHYQLDFRGSSLLPEFSPLR
uniref:Uncharacterized protein n=1 Tax=Oryza rufipogon TaxID=4529 RepID=A0A0E0QZV6_ORYRU